MTTIEIITQAMRNMGDPKFESLADEIERVEEDAIENGPDIFSGVEERKTGLQI